MLTMHLTNLSIRALCAPLTSSLSQPCHSGPSRQNPYPTLFPCQKTEH